MRYQGALRLVALACVLGAIAILMRTEADLPACSTGHGACARDRVPPCNLQLGPWQVTRSRNAGLPPQRSNSACALRASAGGPAVVTIVPQEAGTSGDALLSVREARRADRQRASVRLSARAALPDHWVFAVAGSFL